LKKIARKGYYIDRNFKNHKKNHDLSSKERNKKEKDRNKVKIKINNK
jgi:hypothetical protein